MDKSLQERNKDVVREFYRIKNERDYDKLHTVLKTDFETKFVRHHGEEQAFDIDWMIEKYAEYWRAFPDLYYDVHRLVAEEDWVVARLHYSGTHDGPLEGAPPTGKKINVHQHLSLRIEDGRIAEMYSTADYLTGLWQKIGIVPPMGESE